MNLDGLSKDEPRDYFSRIGGAVFSAGAGGSAGWAPAFWASASGRAGSGGISDGRLPVVTGSDGEPGLLSAPGVDCSGWVACANCSRSLARSWLNESADITSPVATSVDASSRFRRVWRYRQTLRSPRKNVRETNGRGSESFRGQELRGT